MTRAESLPRVHRTASTDRGRVTPGRPPTDRWLAAPRPGTGYAIMQRGSGPLPHGGGGGIMADAARKYSFTGKI